MRKQLLFSNGGLYEGDDLFARAQMLMMLETTIGLLHQDVERLFEGSPDSRSHRRRYTDQMTAFLEALGVSPVCTV